MNLKKHDRVEVLNYAQPKPARVLRKCPRMPRKWIVKFEKTGFIQTVKEENLRKV